MSLDETLRVCERIGIFDSLFPRFASPRSEHMRKENPMRANVHELPGRITRSQAIAFLGSQQIPPVKKAIQQNKKRALQTNPKKASTEESNRSADCADLQRKRRVVLQNVTNVFCDNNSYRNCFNASRVQAKCLKPAKKCQAKLTKVTPSVVVVFSPIKVDLNEKIMDETEKANLKPEKILPPADFSENLPDRLTSTKECDKHEYDLGLEDFEMTTHLQSPSGRDVFEVDDHKDPQLCCIYAADIYKNLRVEELARRPYPNFMETIQRDITQSMRGILVDWLVEVSEEYKLVPDTLYLAVNLIDRFLSANYIERHKLQLVGITCMLISSKYEEICAPRVEEFCFITDSTYMKEEVLKMEIQVLKYFNFQLFAPTAKTFLRRFLRVAQVSYENPSLELEFLANYLAELTLVDYGFLNFLPSVIAASAIFLSRWTLDPTSHPWNPTLEYYTTYKSLDLRTAVTNLQELQLNTNSCPLSAIRTKYRQQKFKSVAALSSQKLPETLFLKTK